MKTKQEPKADKRLTSAGSALQISATQSEIFDWPSSNMKEIFYQPFPPDFPHDTIALSKSLEKWEISQIMCNELFHLHHYWIAARSLSFNSK